MPLVPLMCRFGLAGLGPYGKQRNIHGRRGGIQYFVPLIVCFCPRSCARASELECARCLTERRAENVVASIPGKTIRTHRRNKLNKSESCISNRGLIQALCALHHLVWLPDIRLLTHTSPHWAKVSAGDARRSWRLPRRGGP